LAVSAELIDARDNRHIWGEQYDEEVANTFALQKEIAKEITTAGRLSLDVGISFKSCSGRSCFLWC
jgi:adenylate cyclase